VLTILLVVIIVFGGLNIYISNAKNREVVSEVDAINPGRRSVALVVYQVGLSPLYEGCFICFAEGLSEAGWSVEITTASSQTPTNLSKYSLLVLVYPIYSGSPGMSSPDMWTD